jgi:hypothetical protein
MDHIQRMIDPLRTLLRKWYKKNLLKEVYLIFQE